MRSFALSVLCALLLSGSGSFLCAQTAAPGTGSPQSAPAAPVSAPRDSAALARIDSLLLRYVGAIITEPVVSKERECEFLIGTAKVPELKRHIALKLYDHYKDSPLMGDEAVAIYIYDHWFADGSIPMRGEFDKLEADMFAGLNRQTLLGMRAPKLRFRTPCGRGKTIPVDGRTAVLYFFDTSCAKCKLESAVLPGILDGAGFPLNFYAIYAGQDRKAWAEFRKAFRCKSKDVKVVHLWDPKVKSDFLRTYGVLSTPRLYVVEPQGSILGRRLEAENLQELLPVAATIQRAWEQSR